MRKLDLTELMLISGASDCDCSLSISNAFLAGMRGDDVPYFSTVSTVGGFCGSLGAFLGAIVPLPVNSILGSLIGGSIGVSAGGLLGAFIVSEQYQSGANYVAAMKIING